MWIKDDCSELAEIALDASNLERHNEAEHFIAIYFIIVIPIKMIYTAETAYSSKNKEKQLNNNTWSLQLDD